MLAIVQSSSYEAPIVPPSPAIRFATPIDVVEAFCVPVVQVATTFTFATASSCASTVVEV